MNKYKVQYIVQDKWCDRDIIADDFEAINNYVVFRRRGEVCFIIESRYFIHAELLGKSK